MKLKDTTLCLVLVAFAGCSDSSPGANAGEAAQLARVTLIDSVAIPGMEQSRPVAGAWQFVVIL